MAPVTLAAQPVYGLPRAGRTFSVVKLMPFTLISSGTPFTGAVAPVMLMVVVTNAVVATSVAQTGVVWTNISQLLVTGGNYAGQTLFLGVASSGASTSTTVTMTGNNLQAAAIFGVSGIAGLADLANAAGDTTSLSVGTWRGIMSVCSYYARGGTITGPSEPGWNRMVVNDPAAGIGVITMAWRPGGTATATFSGGTSHTCLAVASLL